VLLGGIYSRVPHDVVVLTDAVTSPGAEEERRGRLRVLRRAIATRQWGVLAPAGVRHHLRVAWHTRTLGARSIVHCARALPEGLAAAIASLAGGPSFVCWTHGEDLITASTSRELSLLNRWVYGRAAAAVANSRNTARLLLDIGVPQQKIEVVYPAVDASRFHPDVDGRPFRRRLGVDDDTTLLLSVGRLQRRKGHDVTLRALAQLGERVPRWHYAIIGDGDERARLECLTRECGIAQRVTFVGEAPDGDLPAAYTASDIFIMPNRVDEGDIEGFGIVFLEAAAAGRPTIGGDSGGVPEAVERDETGLLVDGTRPEAVADAIVVLSSNRALRARLGAAGRDRVLGRFTWTRAAQQIADLHARVAAGR
jgi:phosphatidylinositol alpha-1,6-mannosyltransferase